MDETKNVLHQIFHILIPSDLLIFIIVMGSQVVVILSHGSLAPKDLYLIIELQFNYDRSDVLRDFTDPLALIYCYICAFYANICELCIFYIILTLDRDQIMYD